MQFPYVYLKAAKRKLKPLLMRRVKVSMVFWIALLQKQWLMKEVNKVGTEKERKDTQMAIIYELRRLISKNKDEKESYTIEELCELFDTIAEAKAQE